MPKSEREALAEVMISLGLATGHGDTHVDLLHELVWQVQELLARIPQERN